MTNDSSTVSESPVSQVPVQGEGRGMSDAAVEADKYHQMLALADVFDAAGADMRERARLGPAILSDPDVAETAELSPGSFAQDLAMIASSSR